MQRLMSSAGMAATRSCTPPFLHPSSSSSPAAPSFRALSRLFCSSQGKSDSSSMGGVDSTSIHSKVEDKKLMEWSIDESIWRMPFKFAEVRKKYPRIPAKNVDSSVFWRGREPTKFLGVLDFNIYSVIVKADLKGHEVMKRTMLVIGRDVEELEAATERLNKLRTLLTLLNDLIWNRKQQ